MMRYYASGNGKLFNQPSLTMILGRSPLRALNTMDMVLPPLEWAEQPQCVSCSKLNLRRRIFAHTNIPAVTATTPRAAIFCQSISLTYPFMAGAQLVVTTVLKTRRRQHGRIGRGRPLWRRSNGKAIRSERVLKIDRERDCGGAGWMARRDEGAYSREICNRGTTKPAAPPRRKTDRDIFKTRSHDLHRWRGLLAAKARRLNPRPLSNGSIRASISNTG